MSSDNPTSPVPATPGSPPDRPVTPKRKRKRYRVLLAVLLIYLVALAISHVVRRTGGRETAPVRDPSITLPAVAGDRDTAASVRLVYAEHGAQPASARSTVVLLHGSPGSGGDFFGVLPALAEDHRLIVPDLPGFGESTHDIPDYSIRAHARYVLALMDRLEIGRAHFVGFSMGGGVALNAYDIAPERVESITMLSSIGVQELELFGDYDVNHAIHGAQLWILWLVREAVPHMGALDGAFFGIPYARNFHDTDQRPLRKILERFEPPMLIVHGNEDFLVQPAAAREHHRLVPQSELEMLDASHFVVFTDGPEIGRGIDEFVRRVDEGRAPRRAAAGAERVEAAGQPFDPATIPPYSGVALVIMIGLIVLATYITEDFACIAAGLLVAQGRIGFGAALFGCFVGIFAGDLALFLAGRYLGRPALHRAPFRWFLNEERVAVASRWFDERGPWVIGISRFIPGTRFPTYFTAGLLHTNIFWICVYFTIATFIWTPLLVGLSVLIGERAFGYLHLFQQNAIPALIVLSVLIVFVVHIVIPAFTFQGRRRLFARWQRLRNWEFWPTWIFYPPVVAYVALLGLVYRHPLLFTAANPAIEAGGFIAESKYRILRGLEGAGSVVARTRMLPHTGETEETGTRAESAKGFLQQHGLGYPVVLKPDAGQRGSGVVIARSDEQLTRYLDTAEFDVLIQEYVPGHELGVFYYRLPSEDKGRIYSITDKRMPHVTGNGRDTLEHLILCDRRAVVMAEHYLATQADQLSRVPDDGERVQLVELGTHCRGAIFLDGEKMITPELEREIDRISKTFDGFFFGRYDLRGDLDQIVHGRGFKVIELNGVTSEATNIYDPRHSLFEAYTVLFRQWRLAFRIAYENHAAGAPTVSLGELYRSVRRYLQVSRGHPG